MTSFLKNGLAPFRKLRDWWRRFNTPEEVDLHFEMHLQDQHIRVLNKGFPFQLILGQSGQKLHIYPSPSLKPGPDGITPCFLIFDPDRFFSEISGFMRLETGKTMLIGKVDEQQRAFFQYPSGVCPRYLTIAHARNALIFRDLHTQDGVFISTMTKSRDIQKLSLWRHEKRRKLHAILGDSLQLMSPPQALLALKQVNHIMAHETHRPKDARGVPGGLLVLPDNMTPILVGDLHAQVDNFIKILSENTFLSALERNEAYLVILGDAVHSERDGELDAFESSMLLMDLIFTLKIKFPQQVFYLRGNHDGFSPNIRKGGIPQGVLWGKALRTVRGDAYKKEMDRFYENLPVVAMSKDFLTCHAAPPKAKVTKDLLINTCQYPGLTKELIWNRMRRPNYPAGYTPGDVKRFRKALGLDASVHFIVAHNPLTQEGSVWMNAGKIKNHHILFSGRPHCIAVFTRIGGQMWPLIFPSESYDGVSRPCIMEKE